MVKSANNPTDTLSFRAFQQYKKMFEEMGVNPVDHTKIPNGDPTSFDHLHFMCEICLKNIRDDGRGFHVQKYSRWLGYVQGVLVCRKKTTVDQARNLMRKP